MQAHHIDRRTPSRIDRAVAAVGTFDGVHRGHQGLISLLRQRARAIDGQSVAVTFWPHPRLVLRGLDPGLLCSLDERLALLASLGVDHTIVINFTKDFATLNPRAFVEECLIGSMDLRELVVGYNFAFGKGRAGDAESMTELGKEFGFVTTVLPPVSQGEEAVSSTLVRDAVRAGNLARAEMLLGRPYTLAGPVVKGDGIGEKVLGFPTANLEHACHAIPPEGVYAAWATIPDRPQPLMAAVSIGDNPTFPDRPRRVEAYLLDFRGDLYHRTISLRFISCLRKMVRFDNIDALRRQIVADVALTRNLLERSCDN